MKRPVQSMYTLCQGKCTLSDMAIIRGRRENVHMTEKARHFLREWRDYRGFTLEQVAERVEEIGSGKNSLSQTPLIYPDSMTHVTLSRIETGKQPYKQQHLEILAEIYGTDPASLIVRDPRKQDPLRSVWDKVPPSRHEEALNFLRFISSVKTGI